MTRQLPALTSAPRYDRHPLARALRSAALLALAAAGLTSGAQAAYAPAAPELPAVQKAVATLALPFEQNAGQFEPEVAYLAKTFAGAVFVTRDGRLVYSLPGKAVETESDTISTEPPHLRMQSPPKRDPGWALEERLLDARPLTPRGTAPAVTHVTRITEKGTFQAETWQGIRLGEAWAGIEVELAARGNNFEKLFHVAPGAAPERIRVGLRGARALHVAADGRLIVATGNGEIAYTAPLAWQEIDGERRPVAVRYALLPPDAGAVEAVYGFALDDYDRRLPLTIDPLIQSTYLGGSGADYLYVVAVAANGDVLVGGETYSTDLPGAAGGGQPANRGDRDGFAARLSGDLRTLLQTTYLGGTSTDGINALAVAANGDVLVGGVAYSSNLPGTAGGAQPSNNGGNDGFVARLTGDLRTLVQTTYVGGNNGDLIRALVLATNGDVLVGGNTFSTDLPGTANGSQSEHGGTVDGFVTRLTGDLRTRIQSTYFGGAGIDFVLSLAEAANGDVLLGGYTASPDLPGTTNGSQELYGGGMYDGFVARLSGDLRTRIQSTYLGGSGSENLGTLALAANGDVLVGGHTESGDLPGTANGVQSEYGGRRDGFVTRLSGDLRTRLQSTYLGGDFEDTIASLALADDGDVLVVGYTNSADLPGTAGGAQPGYGGSYDGFVARLSGDLRTSLQSTYLGGSDLDYLFGLAVTAPEMVLVGGQTRSLDLPAIANGAQQSPGGGDYDGFVARLSADLRAISPQTITFPPQADRFFVSGGTFAIDPPATASSGLPISYASDTPGQCLVSGHTVTMVAAGICTIVASQAGDDHWLPAPDVSQEILLTTDIDPELFSDGFESGGTSNWSHAHP